MSTQTTGSSSRSRHLFQPDGFVGRKEELRRLEETLEYSRKQAFALAMLVGEAGAGKTRTAREFAAQVESAGEAVIWANCQEGSATSPYGMCAALLRSYARRVGSEQLRTDLAGGVREVLEAVPELRASLGDAGSTPELSPRDAQLRFFDALVDFLRLAARRTVLVVVIDNLQWADRSSLRFLEYLAYQVADARTAHANPIPRTTLDFAWQRPLTRSEYYDPPPRWRW